MDLKICTLCGLEKRIESNRSTCSACRKKQSRGTLQEVSEEEVDQGAPEDLADTPPPIPEGDPELPTLLDRARAMGIRVENGKAWRSVSGHGKENGYWVTPHECKFGLCLNPDCKLRS